MIAARSRQALRAPRRPRSGGDDLVRPPRLVLEATAARSANGQRVLDAIDVLVSVDDARQAMERYLDLHKREPTRELYVAHTSCDTLEIQERRWAGVRAP